MRHTRRTDCTAGLAVIVGLCLGACGGAGGHALPTPSVAIVDQQYDPTGLPIASQSVSPADRWAQTFRAGISGRLEQVDLLIHQAQPGPLVMSIHPTTVGAPDGNDSTVMAVIIVPDGNVSPTAEWHTFDLTGSDVNVTAGVAYAIVLTAPSAAFRWEGHVLPVDEYERGSAFARDPTVGPWDGRHPMDLAFRTWVRP